MERSRLNFPAVLLVSGLTTACGDFDSENVSPDACFNELVSGRDVNVSNKLALTTVEDGAVVSDYGAAEAVEATKPGRPDEIPRFSEYVNKVVVLAVNLDSVDPLEGINDFGRNAEDYGDNGYWEAGDVLKGWIVGDAEDISGIDEEVADHLASGDAVVIFNGLPDGWQELDWAWIATYECKDLIRDERGELIHEFTGYPIDTAE